TPCSSTTPLSAPFSSRLPAASSPRCARACSASTCAIATRSPPPRTRTVTSRPVGPRAHSSSCPSVGLRYGVEGPARGARTSSAFTTRRTPRTVLATLSARAFCSAETTSPVRYTTDCRLTTPNRVRLASFSATRRAFTSLSIRASCLGSTVAQPLTATTRPTRTSDQKGRLISLQHGTAVRSRPAQEAPQDSGAARRARILRLDQVHLDPAFRPFRGRKGSHFQPPAVDAGLRDPFAHRFEAPGREVSEVRLRWPFVRRLLLGRRAIRRWSRL